MLHILIHLDRHFERATSQEISLMLNTNPVVIRRMMSGLRNKGYVISEKGHGGGWELKTPLEEITLLDVYQAIGEPPLFNIGPQQPNSECLVEQAVDAHLEKTLAEAEKSLLDKFRTITVAELAKDFEQRFEVLLKEKGAGEKRHSFKGFKHNLL